MILKLRIAFATLFSAACLTAQCWANHPVLVEGNSDSPVPGTTLVAPGTSGDFDGDGRIGTAEDTDGADRIFGTVSAALGPGTGAAAGTGVNLNGSITIVTSGRFAQNLVIDAGIGIGGNLTLEAAPGVRAQIDAVLQGDPAGQSSARQGGVGITINMPATRVVTLRNLVIRNFAKGIVIQGASRVNIEDCVIENNRDHGIQVSDSARVNIVNTRVIGTGFRVGTLGDTADADVPTPGIGIEFGRGTKGMISRTSVTQSFGVALKSAGKVSRTQFTQFDNNKGAE
jgi:parallel beta-helix repeat protein